MQEKLEGGQLGEGGEKKPTEPEPILTCVHCSAEYKESENAGNLIALSLLICIAWHNYSALDIYSLVKLIYIYTYISNH